MFNCLNKPLRIYRYSSIGDLYPVDSGQESFEENSVGANYKVVSPKIPERGAEVLSGAKQCSAVFVEDLEKASASVEELFPTTSDLVLVTTYADCISRGPWDWGSAKEGQHTTTKVPLRQSRYHLVESPSTRHKRCVAKWMKCWKRGL